MAAHRKSAHRKPKQRPFTGPAARTAATLALAGAATATSATGAGAAPAEPAPTAAQVRAKVDRLYHDAEVATEKYNGAKEKEAAATKAVDTLADESARRTDRLNTARHTLGSMATAQYRTGALDPAVQLALSSDPDSYLERAAHLDRAGDRQASLLSSIRRQLSGIARVKARADQETAALAARRAELQEHRTAIRTKLADARTLLATLTAAERAAYERSADAAHGGGPATPAARSTAHADRSAPRASAAAPNSRAARAVSFAHGAIGKPYVWGATGPNAFDCSGLTQAAWQAAGVSLPRTTYTQINAGRRVSRSELAPGDLVFFYSGISHVGLYIGGGQMIHAPRPGAPVRIAPIDQMPFAGATRVA
ncbi:MULTISPECIES: C40 family peptidase [unclassified Streptomyces]|uniref:C40 family peptidase n=1 Tax=unclassified Streptomyces TaxID=2593676 RepID=UPI00081DA75F|nr:C40 family peptidase [Streptomyces sp. ScaeMP-e83]MYR95811.1 NlpC/P60 family protein [Streptomyces sp. SID4937]SCD97723.1 Cell wall-associated hydrolase, NlpC family [Streptomyces sp. ScaeMP-e83]